MKRIDQFPLIIILLLFFVNSFGQNISLIDTSSKRNEVKIGINKTDNNINNDEKGPKGFSEYERDVVSLCGYTLRTIQLMITILSVVIGLVSFASAGAIFLYRQKLSKIDEKSTQLSDKVSLQENKISSVELSVQNLDEKKNNIHSILDNFEKEIKDYNNELKKINDEKEHIEFDYKVLAYNLNALCKIIQIQDLNNPRRLSIVRELGEMVNPIGISTLLAILQNDKEELILRIEVAAYLGRFSENKDTNDYWRQIIEGFRSILDDRKIDENLFLSVIKSSSKYINDIIIIYSNLIEWSRDPRDSIRRSCAEAFGHCLISDAQIEQRLNEMITSDTSNEVRAAALASLSQFKRV